MVMFSFFVKKYSVLCIIRVQIILFEDYLCMSLLLARARGHGEWKSARRAHLLSLCLAKGAVSV
jgi:hypothetical protein